MLEGFFPSFSDHRIGNYISKIAKHTYTMNGRAAMASTMLLDWQSVGGECCRLEVGAHTFEGNDILSFGAYFADRI